MTTKREGHSCVEFEGMYLVVGGFGYFYSNKT